MPVQEMYVEIAKGDPHDLVAAIRDGVCMDCLTCSQPLEQRF